MACASRHTVYAYMPKFHLDRFIASPLRGENPQIWLYFQLHHSCKRHLTNTVTSILLLRPRKRLRSIVMSTSVCVSVCPRGYLRNHTRDLYQFLCTLPIAVARSSSGRVTKSRGEGVILGGFFPTDNALYSIAFGTRTKTAEPIEMPFGTISGLGPRNSVLRGVTIPDGEGAILGKTCARQA